MQNFRLKYMDEIAELVSHQEYIKYKAREGTNISELSGNFYFKSYQRILQNFISFHSNIQRLILKYETGAGKTNTAINAANSWVDSRRAIGLESKVVVIGFTKKVFVKEMLSRPELGFITETEISEMKEKRELFKIGLMTKDDYKQYIAAIKRRITSASLGGYFKFIGYKELANDLFGLSDLEDIDLKARIEDNTIKINMNVMNLFNDSFVIIDEFHKLYNSRRLNTYGIAVKYVLDNHPSPMKVLFLSATTEYNSPREIVDVINIINGTNIPDSELFDGDTPIQGAISKIKELTRGKVCYVRNEDPKLYPTRSFQGESLKDIPYLKFVRCKASKEHAAILKKLGNLQIEEYPVMDYILPGPNGYIYKSSEVSDIYASDWANKYRVKTSDGFIHIANIDLSICSAKYSMLLEILKECVGKVLIFHPRIRSSGVIFISDMLREAGYISYGEIPANNTICKICKKPVHDVTDHRYIPSRYVIIHGELGKNEMEEVLDIFNGPENINGDMCQICIGSEIITESLNFKAVLDHIIVGIVDSSGALIQLLGRTVRLGSHIGLPDKKQHVNVHILTHYTDKNELSHEEQKYASIMQRHKIIQIIDKALHEAAIDSVTNYPIIKRGLEDNINILKYDPDYEEPKQINYNMFYKYFMDQEIFEIMDAVKIIFRVYSKVWTVEDLWEFFHIIDVNFEFDTSRITYEAFNIAINNMVNGVDLPFSKNRPIFHIGGLPHTIAHIESGDKKLLIAVPCYTKRSIIGEDTTLYNYAIDIDSWYRAPAITMQNVIAIKDYMKAEAAPIETIREKFLNESINLNEMELIDSMNDYDESFHIHMIKYCIAYIFNVLTNFDIPLMEYHLIIVRVLHAYTMLGYILYASDVEPKRSLYKPYVTNEQIENCYDNMLISRSRGLESQEFFSFKRFNEIVGESKRIPDSKIHDLIIKKAKINKVPADMLPVAYSISTTSKYEYSYYDPKNNLWVIEYEPLYDIISEENEFIIGYDIDISGVLGKVFKLRKPITTVSDKRLLSKGMNCGTHKKEQIKEIASMLNITVDLTKIKYACQDIKKELLRRETESRRNKDNIKWFYFSFENNPIRH